MITDIKVIEMVSVPEQVLQCLIWNCELAVAGLGKSEEIVGYECRELQRYLDKELTDKEKSLEKFNNVEFVNFPKP